MLYICCSDNSPHKYLTIAGAIAWHGLFSERTLPALIGTVNCSGDESGILNCHHVDSPRCDRFSDAEVICQGKTCMVTYSSKYIN